MSRKMPLYTPALIQETAREYFENHRNIFCRGWLRLENHFDSDSGKPRLRIKHPLQGWKSER